MVGDMLSCVAFLASHLLRAIVFGHCDVARRRVRELRDFRAGMNLIRPCFNQFLQNATYADGATTTNRDNKNVIE